MSASAVSFTKTRGRRSPRRLRSAKLRFARRFSLRPKDRTIERSNLTAKKRAPRDRSLSECNGDGERPALQGKRKRNGRDRPPRSSLDASLRCFSLALLLDDDQLENSNDPELPHRQPPRRTPRGSKKEAKYFRASLDGSFRPSASPTTVSSSDSKRGESRGLGMRDIREMRTARGTSRGKERERGRSRSFDRCQPTLTVCAWRQFPFPSCAGASRKRQCDDGQTVVGRLLCFKKKESAARAAENIRVAA